MGLGAGRGNLFRPMNRHKIMFSRDGKRAIETLNPRQRTAVTFTGGPLLILAGPGSGKTRALTCRAAYLILEKGVSPENILLLTFTNKAAEEMKKRIKRLLTDHRPQTTVHGNQPRTLNLERVPYAGTFHSFCARILRRHGHYSDWPPNFLIYDEDDSKSALRQILKKLNLSSKEFSPGFVLALISGAKNELLGPEEYAKIAEGPRQETAAEIYPLYQKLLKKANALDFDDLLSETVKLFTNHPKLLESYQTTYQYILIDEYHDTNHAQYELTKLLAKGRQNLTVVADCSQSIYSFRGADFTNVLKLKHDFPRLSVIYLEENYRSTKKILAAASSLIAHNRTHPVLKLHTQNEEGEKIGVFEALDEREEARFILATLTTLTSPAAVLYRTNTQSRPLEEVFIKAKIPYILVGGFRFYERQEIKDLLAYLRLLVHPQDPVSILRAEKIGRKRLDKFLSFAKTIKQPQEIPTLTLLDQLLENTAYLSLYDPKNEEDLARLDSARQARLENIKEFRSVAHEFPKINDFLENAALMQKENGETKSLLGEKPTVYLMTLHSAKGLEFSTVFIVGLEEGLLPHSRSLTNNLELEEERRLFYVGITRAQQRLYFSFARRRLYFGRHSPQIPSRFLAEIPKDLLEII